MILDSKNIKYDIVDISEPGKEEEKDYMQTHSTSKGGTASDPNPRHPLPPQVFYDSEYCGDFEQFELANEIDNLEDFLKLPEEERPQVHKSTLDTSKIDENHPNGKVIEDEEVEKPTDEDKENKTDDQDEIVRDVVEDGEFGDGIVQENAAKKETLVDSKPLSAQESIAEEEEDELEIEEKKQNTELPATAPKELTESEKLILSEQQGQ
ncbi:hypothetical protein ACKWTF_003898 [Chironomus riparius]